MSKLWIGILISILITGLGFIIPIENLFWFCLITGLIGFGSRFIEIHIVDLLPLVIVAPIIYIVLTIVFTRNLEISLLENTLTFIIKLIPSIYIGNIASEILLSFGIR